MANRDVAQLLIASAVLMTVTGSLHAQSADPAPIPTSDIPKLKAQLYDPQSSAPQREQAASRLLVRPEPDARVLLGGTLLDYSNPAAQFAAARALALNPTADASLITPLFALIDPAPVAMVGVSAAAFDLIEPALREAIAQTAGGQHSESISFDTEPNELPLIREGCAMRALTFVDQEIFAPGAQARTGAGKNVA